MDKVEQLAVAISTNRNSAITVPPRNLLNLRAGRPLLPEGKCLYIQAGDPSDFDGYLIGYAGMELERHTTDFEFALVVRGQQHG
jgi:hypothetical protein